MNEVPMEALNLALAGMLLISVVATVLFHRVNRLSDLLIRVPAKYVHSSGSSWDRTPISSLDRLPRHGRRSFPSAE